jgi:hypothetical protein
MANGLSPAGSQLFAGTGLGDLLSQQVGETADELRRRRLAELQGRPDLTGTTGSVIGGLGGPATAFGLLR